MNQLNDHKGRHQQFCQAEEVVQTSQADVLTSPRQQDIVSYTVNGCFDFTTKTGYSLRVFIILRHEMCPAGMEKEFIHHQAPLEKLQLLKK